MFFVTATSHRFAGRRAGPLDWRINICMQTRSLPLYTRLLNSLTTKNSTQRQQKHTGLSTTMELFFHIATVLPLVELVPTMSTLPWIP